MKSFSAEDIAGMEKIPRLNLINSCTGYKSANLIGTIHVDGTPNVAVFSSVTHLGSNPPMLGFVVRPTSVPRDTYANLRRTGSFTVNHIRADMIADAHMTSARFEEGASEFDYTSLTAVFEDGIDVPFVAGSPVRLLCRYMNEYAIEENNTILIVATIERIDCDPELLHDDMWLQLDRGDVVSVSGVDAYALPRTIDRFSYAKPGQPLRSLLGKQGSDD
ncbi:MAG: flavin reductase family protein [Spirochaetaceae bacterium]|nr:MAG: flavin reductase family protein [Spirochaetaceae bacterium]